MSESLKVAVIGAGVAGLASARELKREGHCVVVYEKSELLGGTWVYDPRVEPDPLGLDPNREIVHGSLYSSLCTNLPRQLKGFSDYPFEIKRNGENEIRTFPRHEEVLKFLNEFARDFGLVELIQFNTEVVRVQRDDSRNDLWMVKSKMSGLSQEETFDAVVVCNGHHTQPRLADIPGIEKWPGKQIHSHNYRLPEPFQDQVVVVIGDRTSAHDISREIAKVAKEVHLSSRSPGVKVSNFDNIWQHSKIECVYENGEVAFEDGASVHAHIILYCTGYKFNFPFLETNGIVSVDDNRVGPLYKHVFPPKLAPTLSFIGIPYWVLPFHMMEFQARWVARVLSGKVLLPSEKEMMTDIEKHYQRMEEVGKPKHHTHCLHSDEFEYLDWLAAQTGEAKVDEGLKEIYRITYKLIAKFLADRGRTNFRELVETGVLQGKRGAAS